MKKFNLILLILLLITNITGCKKNKKNAGADISNPVEIKENHSWYYFANNSLKKIDKLLNVPMQPQIPWTEAIRISSINNAADSSDITKAFAVVNRLGIICFEKETINLGTDVNIFNDRTAGNLVFINNTPVFSVYKSSFFNNTITDPNYKNNQSTHLFLVQFDEITKTSFPLINCNNITDEINSEVTDFHWDGLNWIVSIKTISDVKNSFSYVQFKPSAPILDLSPSTTKDKLLITETDADTFRKSKEMQEYKYTPERIKSLLSGFDKTKNFEIEVKNAGGASSRFFSNIVSENEKNELHATAVISQSWSAALFEDGTLFIEGALPGKHILRDGKTVAIRLPKLPPDFVYSDFAISGTTLYAAWEETNFYKTGRSGFLQVNLDKTLYSRIF